MAKGRSAAAGLLLALLLGTPAAAQQNAYCVACVDQRWDAMEKMLLARAQRLKAARNLLRDAQQRGDAALVQKAQAYLATSQRLWDEVHASAAALGAPTYKAWLARNLVEVEASYDAAVAERRRKEAQYQKLSGALGDQRAGILREMDGIVKEQAQQGRTLAINTFFLANAGGALAAERMVHHLASLPNGPAEHAARIALLNQFIGSSRTLEAGRAAHEAAGGHYRDAGVEAGQVALGILAPLAPAAPWLVGAAVVAGPAARVSFGVAELALSSMQWREAQERLADVRSVELKWQFDVAVLAARVDNLKHEREMASASIERQRAFEAQFARARAEAAP
jgi:hypothetical protein